MTHLPPPITGGFSHSAQYTCTVALVPTSEILRKLEVDVTDMFKLFKQVEEHAYRKFARENYEPLSPIPEIWHPVIRDECRIINEEAETTLEEYMCER